jgi:hypothetical protein
MGICLDARDPEYAIAKFGDGTKAALNRWRERLWLSPVGMADGLLDPCQVKFALRNADAGMMCQIQRF